MHEDGFNDCLNFIRPRNVVDPVLHTIDNYRAEELQRLGKEKAVVDTGLGCTEGVREDVTAGGAIPEAGGVTGETVSPIQAIPYGGGGPSFGVTQTYGQTMAA